MILNLLILIGSNLSMIMCSQSPKCPVKSFNNRKYYFIIYNHIGYSVLEHPGTKTMAKEPDYRIHKKWIHIPLFRIISGSGVKAYNYYSGSKDFNNLTDDFRKNISKNFKSPLLKKWGGFRPGKMNISLRDVNNQILAYLAFRVDATNDQQSWFNRSNLNDLFPWKRTAIMTENLNIFSIEGQKEADRWRTFLIYRSLGYCIFDLGVMAVYEMVPDYCGYLTTRAIPTIAYFESQGRTGLARTDTKYAHSLEITGTYDADVQIFIRD